MAFIKLDAIFYVFWAVVHFSFFSFGPGYTLLFRRGGDSRYYPAAFLRLVLYSAFIYYFFLPQSCAELRKGESCGVSFIRMNLICH